MKQHRKRLHQALRRSQLSDPSPANFVLFGTMISLLTFLFAFRVMSNIQTIIISPLPDRTEKIYLAKVEVPQQDLRVGRLQRFLTAKGSPLARYAGKIVSEADKYDIGYTKLVSISRIESQYGTTNPDGSHNAWGIMRSGKFVYFTSWDEGIEFTSKLLGGRYKLSEYTAIKESYCPASDGCNPRWAHVAIEASNEVLAMTVEN